MIEPLVALLIDLLYHIFGLCVFPKWSKRKEQTFTTCSFLLHRSCEMFPKWYAISTFSPEASTVQASRPSSVGMGRHWALPAPETWTTKISWCFKNCIYGPIYRLWSYMLNAFGNGFFFEAPHLHPALTKLHRLLLGTSFTEPDGQVAAGTSMNRQAKRPNKWTTQWVVMYKYAKIHRDLKKWTYKHTNTWT